MIKQLFSIFTLLFLSASLYAQEATDTTATAYAVSSVVSGVVQTIVREVPVSILPSANLTQQLQGRMSGLFATSASGRPGAPAIIIIRGQNSIDGDSEPYYIVNGIPMTSTQLSSINMEDIESVTILKDAIATARYGVNGGNGVVVIETKKGRVGATRITVSAETGFSNILKNKFGLMNTRQKLDYEKGLGIIDQATYDARLPYNNNLMDEIYRTAWLQQYNIQLSGGSDRVTYYLSGGYYAQDGIHHNSDFKRFTINSNVNINATKWLGAGMYIYMGKDKNNVPLITDLTLASIQLNPYEQLKNSDGSYNKTLVNGRTNPLYEASMFSNELSNTNISGTGYLNFIFARKLTLRSSIALSQYEADEYLDKDSGNSYYYAEHSDNKNSSITQTNKFSFNSYLGSNEKHKIAASLSQEYRVIDDKLMETSIELYSGSVSYKNIRNNKSKNLSGMLELTYSYKDIFSFNATYRMDRLDLSSTPDDNTAKSWAIGGRWNVYDKSYNFFSRLSVRASTGEVAHLPLMLTQPSYTNPLSFRNPTASLFAINITPWEMTKTYNFGVDAYFMNNKLSLYADIYHKTTSNVFTQQPLPANPWQIITNENAKVENKGFEMSLSWYPINHYRYFLSFSANLTLNQNKIKELPYSSSLLSDVQLLEEGKSMGGYYLARWAGVNPSTGEAMWYDNFGNTTNSYYDAKREYIEGKSSIPSKSAGFSITGGYKGLSLSANFYGIWDIYTYNQNLRNIEISNGDYVRSYNLTTNAASYWKNSGDITDIPKPYTGAYSDTRLLQNHSYFRLKSLTLSYDFEPRILRRLSIVNACRLYVTAYNLFTITGYRGFTPEVLGSIDHGAYPESRTISWGIKLTFK